MPSRSWQHPLTCAGAGSIQLIHSGRALRALSDVIVGALVTWAIYTQGQLLL